MIEDREGKGVEATASVTDRFLDAARKRPELAGVFTNFSARVPQLRFDIDRVKARRLGVAVSDVFSVLQTNLGAYYVNDFNLYGKTWKVLVQAEARDRNRPEDIGRLYVLNNKGDKVPLNALGQVKYTLGPIDVPHYNMYTSARITGQPAPGYSSGQAIAAMQAVADEVLPEGFGYEWTGTTYQEQKTGNMATYIFALSVVCVFLFMAALYESWIRPMVIILTVPLATFGAMVGLWLYDMPLDVFGQIGLVMLIGLETKNAILIVEFGVELMEKHGMSIIDSAKEASRQRLRPILMTSFAFVFGVLPMAQATGAGAYSRNSLGVVIAFGIAVSTVLGRFVIPIYYVLGERLRGSRPILRLEPDEHDQPDLAEDVERHVVQPEADHRPEGGQGDRQDDHHRPDPALVEGGHEEEDADDRQGEDEGRHVARLLLLVGRAGPLVAEALRQDLGGDRLHRAIAWPEL